MLILDPCPFDKSPRPITARRLAAAGRAIEREKHRLPLFASEVTITPDERLARWSEYEVAHKKALRAHYVRTLRDLRRVWRSIPAEKRPELETAWAEATWPKTPTYALGWLKSRGYCTITGQFDKEKKEFLVIVTPTTPA